MLEVDCKIPGVCRKQGVVLLDAVTILRHFGLPTDEAHQRCLAKGFRELCEEHGIACVDHWQPRGTAMSVN